MGFIQKAAITILILYGIGLGITLGIYLFAIMFQVLQTNLGLTVENPFTLLFNASWEVTVFTFIAPVGVSAFTLAMALDWFMPPIFAFVNTIWNGLWMEVFGFAWMQLSLTWTKALPTVMQAVTDLASFIETIKPTVA